MIYGYRYTKELIMKRIASVLSNHFAGKETPESVRLLDSLYKKLADSGLPPPFKLAQMGPEPEKMSRKDFFDMMEDYIVDNKLEIGYNEDDWEEYRELDENGFHTLFMLAQKLVQEGKITQELVDEYFDLKKHDRLDLYGTRYKE